MEQRNDQLVGLRHKKISNYLERTRGFFEETNVYGKLSPYILANLVRIVYILQGTFCIFYVTNITRDRFYLFLIALLIHILIDASFVTITRGGTEYYWFSLSTFLYSVIIMTVIWTLVFEKYDDNDVKCNKDLAQNQESAFWKSDFRNICSWLEIIVSLFMFTMALGHFVLPQSIKRLALLGILQDSLINSADSVELFSYSDEPAIRRDFGVVYIILWLFSLSTLQYCFSLGARRTRNPDCTGFEKFLDIVLGTEIWPLLLVLLTMDLPFFCMRFTILMRYESITKNYTLYFFVTKNLLLVIFGIYKIAIITVEELIGKGDEDDNDSQMSDRAG